MNIRSQHIGIILKPRIVYAAELNWRYLWEHATLKQIYSGANIQAHRVRRKSKNSGLLLRAISKNLSSGQTFWISTQATEPRHIKSWGALNLILSPPQRKQHLQIKKTDENLHVKMKDDISMCYIRSF